MTASRNIPAAVIRPERRHTLAWLIPVGALLLAAWLGWGAWRARGDLVVVQFSAGHGVRVGDPVRYRGTEIGVVRQVSLAEDLQDIRLTLRLQEHSARFARAGARFWIVRPRVRLTGIEGADTIVGPRYVAVAPGPSGAARQREFVGVDEAPVVVTEGEGDLEVIVDAARRGGIERGAPVSYRQVRIGTVRSVALASDGSRVELRLHVTRGYRDLIRAGSRFWREGGLRANLGFSGLDVEVGSLAEMVSGGIAVATPPAEDAGAPVRTGHRFALADSADDDWLTWSPSVAIGSELIAGAGPLPHPLRAQINWRTGRVIRRSHGRAAWVLSVADGLLGPSDVLMMPEKAQPDSVELEVAGRGVPVLADALREHGPLTTMHADVEGTSWPASRIRVATEPEDVLMIGDPGASAFPVAAARLTREGGGFAIDAALSLDPTWHGAVIVSRQDGAVIGMLLSDDDGARVVDPPAQR